MFVNTSYVHVVILAVAIVVYAACIWAFVVTVRNAATPMPLKVVWGIALLLLPPFGLIAWALTRVSGLLSHRSPDGGR